VKDNKYQIKLFNKIADCGTERLQSGFFEIGEDIADPDGILVRSADLKNVQFGSNLLCIGRAGIGVNNIPIDVCSEKGIAVFNTPGANANAVKELAVCAMLLASRNIAGGIEWAKTLDGKGDEVPALVEKGKSKFIGPELKGKSLGVIGLGAIGATLANIAYRLGMDVYGYDPFMTVENAWTINRLITRVTALKEIYENCDYISIHIPLNNETRGTICANTIKDMRDGVRIINLARGELVNDDDIAAALESGKVGKYVTDFPNAKTLKMKNTICIPHLGASTPESEDNCAVMAADEIADYILNGNIKNSVNLPDIYMPREEKYRLCVIHRNIPNMLGLISTTLAALGFNIEHMSNRSKKDYACTILETSSEITDKVIDNIKAIAGMLRVRVIK